jgi:cyclopropane fatty-acyl-phospholipid synthase-like methyltransferase
MAKKAKKHNDPFGQAIADYWEKPNHSVIQLFINGKKDPSMVAAYFFRSYAKMKQAEKEALHHCRGSVLDVGAAAGCHSIVLQKRGFAVTALDHSQLACEVMRKRGVARVVHSTIQNYKSKKFDTILVLMNGFGIAGSEDSLPSFIRHLKSLLKPGGQILADSTDISYFRNSQHTEESQQKQYSSDLHFRIKYKEHACELPWTYPNMATIAKASKACKMNMEVLSHVASGGFLVRLV